MITYRQPFKNEWPITQSYGDNITSNFHTGIDYGCPFGTPILSSADGIVVFAGWDKTGYGNFVIIYHSAERATCYAHLSDISVALNRKVRQGELIGHSGNTGNSTGPHLHFEARTNWSDYKSHFNPMNLPLISVYDDLPSKSENGLLNADEINSGNVIVVAPSGVFGHYDDFTKKESFNCGTKFIYTGNYIERNNLQFCECIRTVWIAANDGKTQLLKNE